MKKLTISLKAAEFYFEERARIDRLIVGYDDLTLIRDDYRDAIRLILRSPTHGVAISVIDVDIFNLPHASALSFLCKTYEDTRDLLLGKKKTPPVDATFPAGSSHNEWGEIAK